MMLRPSLVKEYSTALALDLAACLAINPADSRWRSVRVSMRWETLPTLRRSSACRCGLSLSENRIFGVQRPMKIGPGISGLAC